MNFNKNINANEPLFNYQWFKSKSPKKGDIIIGFVDSIGTSQVDITILNYNKVKGIIAFNELSSKKVRSIRTLFKEGDVKPFIVTNVSAKEDMVYIDLSFKNINDYAEEIAALEKYHLILLVMFKWFKDQQKSMYFGKSKKSNISSLLSQSTNDINAIQSINELNKSISLSNIVLTNNESSSDLINQYCDIDQTTGINIDTMCETTCDNACETTYDTSIESISPQKPFKIDYLYDDWNNLMELTIWSYSYSKIYKKFLDIKTKQLSIETVFSNLFSRLDGQLFIGEKCVTKQNLTELNDLIDKFISYEITINITVNLTCWGIKSLDKIKNIVQNISTIPETYYRSEFEFSNITINSPKYEFSIKSSDKLLMDHLFKQNTDENAKLDNDSESDSESDSDNDEVLNENENENESNIVVDVNVDTKYLSLIDQFNKILSSIKDINYSIEIKREDKF